jgi:hypothetical protein
VNRTIPQYDGLWWRQTRCHTSKLRSCYRTSPESGGLVWIRRMSDLRTVNCITVKYPISEHGQSPRKPFRLAGSFAYRNPISHFPNRPSRKIPFADRNESLMGFFFVDSIGLNQKFSDTLRLLVLESFEDSTASLPLDPSGRACSR